MSEPLDMERVAALREAPGRRLMPAAPLHGDSRILGGVALSMAEHLLNAPPVRKQPYWNDNDRRALGQAIYLESTVEETEYGAEIPAGRRDAVAANVRGLIRRYHDALPYDDIEWHWLLDTHEQLREADNVVGEAEPDNGAWHRLLRQQQRERPLRIAKMRADVQVGGGTQHIEGRDLVRRWWAWRRSSHEFEDGKSLNAARLALVDLGELLVPTQAEAEAAGIASLLGASYLHEDKVALIQQIREAAEAQPA
ncbi:hypothetical protein [Conexibacter sp. CPCC 206217]|uniref:hypothetical protein n=1 Tax=Conexibacter sp. CPCC 206217 TaxID=3064574 RepID=UPI00271C2541|nr:hypothetical protein [Conexibacter sp. CPCC 206217]MDO8213470.1 hypothetical protein [Conexibacter sp. CPCC 206217]